MKDKLSNTAVVLSALISDVSLGVLETSNQLRRLKSFMDRRFPNYRHPALPEKRLIANVDMTSGLEHYFELTSSLTGRPTNRLSADSLAKHSISSSGPLEISAQNGRTTQAAGAPHTNIEATKFKFHTFDPSSLVKK